MSPASDTTFDTFSSPQPDYGPTCHGFLVHTNIYVSVSVADDQKSSAGDSRGISPATLTGVEKKREIHSGTSGVKAVGKVPRPTRAGRVTENGHRSISPSLFHAVEWWKIIQIILINVVSLYIVVKKYLCQRLQRPRRSLLHNRLRNQQLLTQGGNLVTSQSFDVMVTAL
ncbi:hypothetical protein Aperf_G00000043515 [Anoplocephala perfoliata]